MNKRVETDWESQLLPEEIFEDRSTGRQTVLLKGLQRLARLAGYSGSRIVLNHIMVVSKDQSSSFGIFQCVYTALFADGTEWSGAGDCNRNNTDAEFQAYPTAVAESRAEARALKKALGIAMLAQEEVGFASSNSPKGKISTQVVKLIDTLLERKGLDSATLFRQILSEERRDSVFAISDLTVAEGQQATQYLNSTTTKSSSRSARKAELEEKVK